jgi:hypothetical protein
MTTKMKNSSPKEGLSADVMSALHSATVGEIQQTEEMKFELWLKSRAGKITGSNFGKLDVLPKSKAEKEAGELGQTAKSYLNTVIAETLGAPRKEMDIYQFRHGNKYEPIAIAELEEKIGAELTFTGDNQKCFDLNEYIGATPDGLIGADGGAEVKCPVDPNKHIEHLKIKTVEEFKKKRKDYYWQCVGGMLTTGRKWWLFVSFYPFFGGEMRMSMLVIKRDEDEIAHLQSILGKGKKYFDRTKKEIQSNDTSETIEFLKSNV